MTDAQWSSAVKTRQSIAPYETGRHRVSFCSVEHGYISSVNPDGTVTTRKWLVDIDGSFKVKSTRSGVWVKYRNQYTDAVRLALAMRQIESEVKVVVTRLKSTGRYLVEYRDRHDLSNLVKADTMTLAEFVKNVLPLEVNNLYLGAI